MPSAVTFSLFSALPLRVSVSPRRCVTASQMVAAFLGAHPAYQKPGQTALGVSLALVGSHGHPWAKSLALEDSEALIGQG